MSKMIKSAPSHEGSRPLSASAVTQGTTSLALSSKDSRKRKRRSSSMGSTVMASGGALPTAPGLSPSLDEESGLEEVWSQSVKKDLSTALDKELSTFSGSSVHLSQNCCKDKSTMKERINIRPPEFKLKPRPRRKSASASSRTSLSFSFKTPTPSIFIPFLPSTSNHAPPPPVQKQLEQKPLPPPPLIPNLVAQGPASASSGGLTKIQKSMSDPLSQKKAKRTKTVSKPLSSPPQLIPTFDFGIAAASRDAITPPPVPKRPPAPFTTPPSIMTAHSPLSISSVEALRKNSRGRVFVAKPIARRPLITPSNRNHNSSGSSNDLQHHRIDGSSSSSVVFSQRVFPSSSASTDQTSGAVAKSLILSSSMECSAFSFSSTGPPPSLSTTIRRALSTDDDD